MKTPFFETKLKDEFSKRQRKNRSYSLRAYARDLELHPSTLSSVLGGKRPLPLKNANRISEVLGMNLKERKHFLQSIALRKVALDEIDLKSSLKEELFLEEENHYQIISEWEYYAVLSLAQCEAFVGTPEWVANRFGLSKVRAQVVLEKLQQVGFLARNQAGRLQRTAPRLRTTSDVVSIALQAAHREMLDIAKEKLVKLTPDFREFESLTFAMEIEDLPDVKNLIREFREKMTIFLSTREKKEVFQLNLQLFPLTEMEQAKIKPKNQKTKEKPDANA